MSDSTDDETLATLLLQWEEAWDQGRDLPPENLCALRLDLIETLRDRIAALKQMAWMTKSDIEQDNIENEPDILLGRTLAGRYRIETLIAEGGFGRVYRAFDPELQRHVALKVSKSNRVSSPEQANQLLEEARRAAKLRHPGIVSVYDVGRDDGLVFIVSDLIEGQSLAEMIERNRPKPSDAARIIADVADALQFAHDQGFVHRDIKPANILIDLQGRPHITDFGIAATVEQISKGDAATSGTLAYMAPEQLSGDTHLIGTRTDIHALGVVLYEVLTGKNPFDTDVPSSLREQIILRQPQLTTTSDIPDDLQRICLRCLSKHPSDRFNTAGELAIALRSIKTGKRASRKLWWLVVPLVASLIIAIIWFGKGLVGDRNVQTNNINSTRDVRPEEGTFFFDGKNRIITPLISFAPCTLEAWFRMSDSRQEQFIIGSDVPHNYGIGIGVNNYNPIAESIRGGFHVDMPITPGKWTHLAAVYGPDETKLFVDGKKIGVAAATLPPSIQTRFVIGNVGEDHTNLFFNGQVRCLRISKGERFSTDFEPESSFTPDAADSAHQAILIIDGSKAEGNRVIDLSGNGNDGKWEGISQ